MKTKTILRLLLNPGVSILISPLLLVCYRVMIVGSLIKYKKRYLVTGNWKEYISNIFSDPSFFLLSLFVLLYQLCYHNSRDQAQKAVCLVRVGNFSCCFYYFYGVALSDTICALDWSCSFCIVSKRKFSEEHRGRCCP